MAEPIAETKFCVTCGAQIHAKAEICPKCGVRQPRATSSGGKSRIMAALFGILLGGLGIHKFYLGSTGWGVVYLLFCWTLIPVVVGLIEGIVYLTMSDEAFAAKYEK